MYITTDNYKDKICLEEYFQPAETSISEVDRDKLINLYDSEVPKEIQNKSISINSDISEFMRGVFDID